MSKARKSAEGKPCSLRLACCNGDPTTTVLAHLRMFGWGSMAKKPPDYLAVYACSTCHDALDGRLGNASIEFWEYEDVLRALGETLKSMEADGVLIIK